MSCVSGAALWAVRLPSPGTMKQRKIRKSLLLLSFKPISMHCFETGVWRTNAQIVQQEVKIMQWNLKS
jgi:hypothetical protein